MDIAIIGAGGMGREILCLINKINSKKSSYNFIGWYDDLKEIGILIDGYPVLGKISDINSIESKTALVLAIGYPEQKTKLINKINNNNISFPNLIHPNVSIDSFQHIKLGQGIIIQENTTLTTNITINDFVFLSPNCTIGHDTIIGKYSSVMPGANIAGNVTIGESVLVGISSSVLQGLHLAEESFIGGGACVTRDTQRGLTYVGTPARVFGK
ncbi:NeuD/PglB/VioB family sugar acetyltransferase [Bacteriovorax sp. Seq25_V]|uniref:NeuD/PglB/VioB family sugar acetyltransferase n=1 Tax=Bacteriovorax sp. Seq25_V TaxID=1201288 RepID=UPI00038A03F8|nr:NeuD/PglB/VioB family sugar acetyltransferase [Bacteriovorax sp. Seq25_V]EQC43209.1 sugar O-acyltransferase, sialic acid O-acetyltransferase NeuD family [Bacteriovorax sp. Seq25_V]